MGKTKGPKSAEKSRRLRVLIADDNQPMLNTVIRLVGVEYDVVGAVGDGASLVNAESELKPDIGIIDISMPIMNGVEAAKKMRDRGSKMKIVFLTVNEDPEFLKAALATGASGYVVKKQMASDLLNALSEAREGRSFISSCSAFAENKRHFD